MEPLCFIKTLPYIFKCPNWVDDGLDFAVLVHGENVVDDILNVFRSVLLIEQMTQVEACECLVFIEKLDWGDFIDLPPLEMRE